MKEKKGYKRELLETYVSGWTGKVTRKWRYTWSDGTTEIRKTIKDDQYYLLLLYNFIVRFNAL